MGIVIGNPGRGTTGIALGKGILVLSGPGDPNNFNDAADFNPGVNSCGVGSLFLRTDGPDATHCFYVKTALPNTWTAK